MNELEIDDLWQRAVFDRLLAPVLQQHSYRNQIVFLDIHSSVASLLQKRAHVDIVAQLPHGGTMSIEVKIVRWPGAKERRPAFAHWRDLFLETWSSSVGAQKKGWMYTSQADILLWCQCALHEDRLDCFPYPFQPLRRWVAHHADELPERKVPNIIDGRPLWSIGRLARISTVCRELKTEGFRVNDEGLISDLYGAPLLRFLREPAA
jgi:hypothetical protein